MTEPDTSPTALARLRERLAARIVYVQSSPGSEPFAEPDVLCAEASIAILALEKELGQVRADLRTSSNDANELMRQLGRAEARLLEIADAMDKAISQQRTLGAYYKVGVVSALHRIAAIARSKPTKKEKEFNDPICSKT